MAEPQPPQVHEGGIDQEDEPSVLPASGDARKAAAALSSLDRRGEDDNAKNSQADQEALGKAMSRLEVVEKPVVQNKGKEPEGAKKKTIKVEQADIALLVGLLDFYLPTKGGISEIKLTRNRSRNWN